MKTILLLFIVVFAAQIYSQDIQSRYSSENENSSLNIPQNKYYNSSKCLIFEYGYFFIPSSKDRASTYLITYDFNLKSKRLFGSVQTGLVFAASGKEREEDNKPLVPGVSFSLGLNYNIYTQSIYNLSVYLGAQTMMSGLFPGAVFGAVHIRNTFFLDVNAAFTIGLRYLPRIGVNEHWFMPTAGFQILL
jgi:hypothetical protein